MLNKASIINNLAFTINNSNMCPYIGGPAVFEARAIVYSQNQELIFDDQDLCANVAMRKRKELNVEFVNNSIRVYLNPSKQVFNFEKADVLVNDVIKIQIKDITGRIVKTEEATGLNKTTIDLLNQMGGVYLYEYFINNNLIKTGNLVLIK
jgi:hypothetical protein